MRIFRRILRRIFIVLLIVICSPGVVFAHPLPITAEVDPVVTVSATANKVWKTDGSGVAAWRDDTGSAAWGDITGTLSAQTDLSGALDGKASSLGADDNYVTDAEKIVIGNTSGTNSGTNTGDQTSIVGITGTIAQFNTAITDGDLATGGGTATGTNTGDNTVATTGDSATSFFSSGAVEVAVGGTGVSTLGDAGVLIGNATGAVQVTTAGTSGQVLTSNGAGVDPTFQSAAGGNDPRVIMDALTTGEQFDVTASTTLVEITNLSQTLAAGTYTFQYNVIYCSNQLTNGIRYAVNYSGTNGAFVWWWRWSDVSAAASTAVPDQDGIIAAGQVQGGHASRAKSTTTRGTTLSVDTANVDMLIIIEGVFVATGAGDLELWTASEVNTAGYTTSTMIGTSVIIHKTK